jgi:hypothetical protein
MSIEVPSASVPMIPALTPDALEARPSLPAAPSLFRVGGICASVSCVPRRKFLDLGSFLVIPFELGHHRFLFFRRGVSHFFSGSSVSLVTATDLLHDMVVALFSYLFK